MDFRRAQPGAHLPSLLRLERESPLHEVVERAVASGGGKVESVWWLFEDGARKVTTSVRGEDLQWCRAGDVVRLAQDTPPEDGELLVGLERKYQARLTFRTDAAFTREQFSIANAANGEEIRN